MVQMASTNTILQTVVDEELRGRVMAFYTMAFLGTAPIGSLLAGVVADRIGAPEDDLLGALLCLAGALWLAVQTPHAGRTHPPDLHRARDHADLAAKKRGGDGTRRRGGAEMKRNDWLGHFFRGDQDGDKDE